MATIHQATLTPTKLELLEAWLPGRHWYPADEAPGLRRIAACRFDDPAGEVGVEIFVVRSGADGPLVHVPMTYRGAPLDDGDFFLVGTLEHSVLGSRWVYDAVGDPVYVEALTTAIRTGGGEAPEMVETPDGPRQREASMTVRGTGMAPESAPAGRLVRVEDGDPAVVVAESARLDVRRVLSADPAEGPLSLVATWAGQPPTVLAVLY
ncbi:hypothetical protein ACFQS1_01440 [Paractinoplanes rhizophilus]|jgi:hypothetical protein|uniref:Maltokinase N-terminal cap domain-containing protein n=1 Tax=Paractinoplanes rhizophilus TaxID=1416877 RepID=A0ABW2HIC6_9ACTN|nr:hypothetical protein [Actinoplanes sp.]